jgi:hypothetical protein
MTSPRYLNRPSPPYPGTPCLHWATRGNDGQMYRSLPRTTKSGRVYGQWVRVTRSR